ncbi:MAG TPA: YsnF/AvaK domain-containing protein [Acetobacteraceae bacterium]
MRTIAHVYPTYAEAARVVSSLESAGIPHSDISIVSGDKEHANANQGSMAGTAGTNTGLTSGDPEQGAATGAGTGASLGTVLGGGAGLLAGIGALAIPGIGPLVAAGWLVAALTGAGVGAAAGGLLGSLTGAGISEADAQTYQEGVSSGGTLVTVRADDGQAAHVEQLMGMSTGTAATTPTTGAMDTGALGMTGAAGMGAAGMMGDTAPVRDTTATRDAAMGTDTGMGSTRTSAMDTGVGMTDAASRTAPTSMGTVAGNDTIKVMKEDLVVGKREHEAGGVRVTSHVVETPVQEQVTLHEERVTLERRPMNERVAGAGDAFADKTIEARATSEEAVVGKETRVIEEIGIKKEAADRVETVRDNVRETKVDVEDTSSSTRPTTTTTTTTDTTKRI